MRRAYLVCLSLCVTATSLLSQSNPFSLSNQSLRDVPRIGTSPADPKAQARVLERYGKLPLSFEANFGQTNARVKFLSRTGAYSLFLTGDEAVLMLGGGKTQRANFRGAAHKPHSEAGGVLRMQLHNANPAARVTGVDELAGTSNYFIGNNPAEWRTSVPTYAKVKYEGIYSGIDLVYYGNQRQLEYDFIVAPGANPHRIAFEFRGATKIIRARDGDLVLQIGDREIRWHKPVVYQEKNGSRKLIAADYAIAGANRVRFELAAYDTSRLLYIDPLVYSTYLGGGSSDGSNSIAVDGAGNAYITGGTYSVNFPTKNPLQSDNRGGANVFIAKINPSASALVYSTYLGGGQFDYGSGIAVDSQGNAYVVGVSNSSNFPVTPGAFQTICNNGSNCDQFGDAFVAKIDPTGSALAYSTFLGGSGNDGGHAIAADSAGNAYVTGATYSTDFPVTPGVFQTMCGGNECANSGDAFVAKIDPTGSALVYSTYLGGSGNDYGNSIAIDSSGSAYVTGAAGSNDFPIVNPLQSSSGGGALDAFVSKVNPAGSALVYSTYLGGSGQDQGNAIAVDSSGSAYVTGQTSSDDFPTVNPVQRSNGGNGYTDAFVSKIDPAGSPLVYSTYLGGSSSDWGYGIAVDTMGTAYVTGTTISTDFPTTPGAFQTVCNHGSHCVDYGDAFVAKLAAAGSPLAYSTYLGGSSSEWGYGIAIDSAGTAYVVGATQSKDFPTKNPLQKKNAGVVDAFVTKIALQTVTMTTLTSSPNPSAHGQAVTLTAVVTSKAGDPPDGETVAFRKGTALLGTGTLSGGSANFTTSTLKVGTNSITAVYGGDSNFVGSKSKAVKQVVNP